MGRLGEGSQGVVLRFRITGVKLNPYPASFKLTSHNNFCH